MLIRIAFLHVCTYKSPAIQCLLLSLAPNMYNVIAYCVYVGVGVHVRVCVYPPTQVHVHTCVCAHMSTHLINPLPKMQIISLMYDGIT